MGEEFVACVFAEDQRQLQLFAVQSIPELLPKLEAVFNETIAADHSSLRETDLSIVHGPLVLRPLQAPSDFEFDPRTASVAYIKSLARGIAALDGLDVFLAFLDEAVSKKILDACKAAYRRLHERYACPFSSADTRGSRLVSAGRHASSGPPLKTERHFSRLLRFSSRQSTSFSATLPLL